MGDLEFGLQFQDGVSAPAHAASSALRAVQSNLSGVASASSAATSATDAVGSSLRSASATNALGGVAGGLRNVAFAAEKAASAIKTIDAEWGKIHSKAISTDALAAAAVAADRTRAATGRANKAAYRDSVLRDRARQSVTPGSGEDLGNMRSKGYMAWRAAAAKAATSAFTGYQTTQVSRTAKALESLGGIAKRTWTVLGGGGGGAGRSLAEASGGFERSAKHLEQSGGFFRRALEFATGSLLERGVEKMLELGKDAALTAVEYADFGQRARVAFGSLAKYGADPEKIFTRVRTLAQDLGLDVLSTTKSYQTFLAMQFNPGQADALVKMGSDLRAIGASAEEVQRAYLQIAQIKAKGKLQGEELLVLAENGLSTQLVFESIAKQMGISMAQVQKKISAGSVNASVALNAIGDAILKKTHSTAFGQAGKRMADGTISGLWGQLKARMQNVAIDVGTELAPVLTQQLGGMLTDFAAFAKSDEGKKFFTDMAGAVRDLAIAIKDALPAMRSMLGMSASLISNRVHNETGQPEGQAYSPIGAGLGALAGARFGGMKGAAIGAAAGGGLAAWINNSSWGRAVNNFLGIGQELYASEATQVAQATQVGSDIGAGIVSGMQSKRAEVLMSGADLGNAALEGAQSTLEVHSPSRAMARLGVMGGVGLGVGFSATEAFNVGAVQSVIGSMTQAANDNRISVGAGFSTAATSSVAGISPVLGASVMAGMVGSQSVVPADAMSRGSFGPIKIEININGSNGDPEEVAEATKRGAMEGLSAILDDLGIEAA